MLREAAGTFHKIASAISVRGMRTEHLSTPLYESLMKMKLTDEEMARKAMDAFEKIIILLGELGEKDITIMSCGSEDITP